MEPGEGPAGDAGPRPAAYASVDRPPRLRSSPPLRVPPTLVRAGLQGTVDVRLVLDVGGRVQRVEVLESFHPDATEACREAMRSSRWRPGRQGGLDVPTRDVPYRCRFELTSD